MTPLIFAAKQGNLDIVRTLVENGRADVNLPESVSRETKKLLTCAESCLGK